MDKFSIRLKELRNELKLSQDELADRLKVTRSCIGNYEQGTRQPNYEDLEKIADFFNVDIEYLLGKTNVKRKSSIEVLTPEETMLINTVRTSNMNPADIKHIIKYIQCIYERSDNNGQS